MSNLKDEALRQIDRAIARIDAFLPTYERGEPNAETYRAASLMAVETVRRLSPPGSTYYGKALKDTDTPRYYDVSAMSLRGILTTLRADYEDDCIATFHELIHAEVFGDYLEMAEHLLGEKYKDAAAVITGSTLEEHLRQLCTKHGIATTHAGKPKKADTMNADLKGANVFSGLDQKNVTAWLDLRNKAAHGRYAEYALEDVRVMLLGVRNFLSAHPA